jgi:hypothetical protein
MPNVFKSSFLSDLLSRYRSPAQAVQPDSPESSLLRPRPPSFKKVDYGTTSGARSPLVNAWQNLKGWLSRSAVTAFVSGPRVRATTPITLDRARELSRAGESLARYTIRGEIEVSGPALEEMRQLSLAGADLGDVAVKGRLQTEEPIVLLAEWHPKDHGLRMGGVRLSGEVRLSRTGNLPVWISSLRESGADLSEVTLTGSFSGRNRQVLARVLEVGADMNLSKVICNGAITDPDPESLALIGRALDAHLQMDQLIVVCFPQGPEHDALRRKLDTAHVQLK